MRLIQGFALLLSLCAGMAHAEALDDINARGTLRVGLEGTYPPFNYREGGQLVGFEVELAEALAKEMGVKAAFTTAEWSGLLAGLQGNKYDVVMNQVSVSDKRRKVFDFSQTYTYSSPQLIVREDETRHFSSFEDLVGLKLGVGQGTNFAEQARAVKGIHVQTYPGAPEYLQDLVAKRIDAALNDSLLIPYAIKQAKLPLKAGEPVGAPTEMAIPFQKNNPKLEKAINDALDTLKGNGEFAKISNKWFAQDVSKPAAAQ
ncbi:transporter substrate-binding domain-containing protein [Pseudomonas matsuisoli]|uniref:Cysteine ABC transporter n=1 Tax=Pseudomonas matsuisoli TaxID=1515666 RepID=A0A917PVT0_9PSED|nr:transporter substrate-binding domain-containing protein [Pseudomonas matsuisoli]GGJ94250.1 cysteine ABC transporter [Pseudomonas matsuisoli]